MKHPFHRQTDRAFWSRSVAKHNWFNLPFESETPLFLDTSSKVATAGCCFASSLMRWLPRIGLTPYFAETAPDYFLPDDIKDHGYLEFSARYGNVYTVRQLRQLIEQALGYRAMIEEFGEDKGGIYDLLRPHVRPGGFLSIAEARADRRYHLSCVKKLLMESDAFLYTLGSAETWINSSNNTIYPVCPGAGVGKFDAELHKPISFDYVAILADMRWIIETIRQINPKLRWIIAVSPVHLVATHTDLSVIVASTYSKSVLRAVCGVVSKDYDHVFYFPAYEMIGSAQSFGQYLDSNLREVNERGITHVLDLFNRVFVNKTAPAVPVTPQPVATSFLASIEKAHNAECDELMNEPLQQATD